MKKLLVILLLSLMLGCDNTAIQESYYVELFSNVSEGTSETDFEFSVVTNDEIESWYIDGEEVSLTRSPKYKFDVGDHEIVVITINGASDKITIKVIALEDYEEEDIVESNNEQPIIETETPVEDTLIEEIPATEPEESNNEEPSIEEVTEEAIIEDTVEISEVTETEYIDTIIVEKSIEYVEKEIYIMSEEEIPEVVIEPIETYDNYISMSNKAYGVNSSEFTEIEGISGLIVVDDIIYYNRDGVAYKQIGDTVEESEMPVVESNHIEFDNHPFKIYTHMYNDMETSRVSKFVSEGIEPVEAYLKIDSACMIGDDLLFSVAESYGSRLKGVYIWTVKGNIHRLYEEGRIY